MRRRPRTGTIVALVLAIIGGIALYHEGFRWKAIGLQPSRQADEPADVSHLVRIVSANPQRIRISNEGMTAFGIAITAVQPAPPPEPLRLSGSILMDPNRMVRVHARFPGELISLGVVPVSASRAGSGVISEYRPLQFGDHVKKGQILAVLWSKDVGEKKSEYVDAICRLDIDKTLLDKYKEVESSGVLPQRTLFEARGKYEADLNAVAKAERTLLSWRLTEPEIREIRDEAKRIQMRETSDAKGDRTWAETEIRCPIDGIIVEKNFNIGDILDPTQDLFKIADLERVQVAANALEEDLPLLKNLDVQHRRWKVDIKADPHDVPIDGTFDIIGNIIDPLQHAGAVMGSLDNPDGRLSIGEFINVTIDLPADPALVIFPSSALVEDGHSARVFVETDAKSHEFECRKVAVVSRGREHTYVRGEPNSGELATGAELLKAGQRVIATGTLELAAALNTLQSTAHDR